MGGRALLVGLWVTGSGCSGASPLAPSHSASEGGVEASVDAGIKPAVDAGPERDATAHDARIRSEAGGEAEAGPPEPPPVCPTDVEWGDGTVLSLSTGSDDFGAITPDELTLVWTSGGDAGGFTVSCADRTASSASFGTPQVVPLAAGSFVPGSVSVSPDGLRLVFQAPDTTFFVLTRASRGSAFAASMTTSEFAIINAEISGGEIIEHLGDPLIGASDETFYYSRYPAGVGQNIATVFEADRSGSAPWGDGTAINGAAIEETGGGQRRRPSGISADGRTLFYWDDASGAEMMTWRATPTGAFATAISIGARTGAEPNADCTAIYYSAAASGGTSLFMASRK
jgi:hypothetical protein